MYWKTFLIIVIFSLFLAPSALAWDRCEHGALLPGEVGMCHAYCTHLDCDKILDGDPMSAPQASEMACANVAISLMSMVRDMKRSEIDPVEAMETADHYYCCGCVGPPCDCGGGGGF